MAVNSQHHLTNCIEKYMDSRKIKKYMEKLDNIYVSKSINPARLFCRLLSQKL